MSFVVKIIRGSGDSGHIDRYVAAYDPTTDPVTLVTTPDVAEAKRYPELTDLRDDLRRAVPGTGVPIGGGRHNARRPLSEFHISIERVP